MPTTHSSLLTGDFNSHYQFWEYDHNDPNGDFLNEWAERENLELVFDEKNRDRSKSGRWQCDYNPDLCFTIKD